MVRFLGTVPHLPAYQPLRATHLRLWESVQMTRGNCISHRDWNPDGHCRRLAGHAPPTVKHLDGSKIAPTRDAII
jgi:hypothetical protein